MNCLQLARKLSVLSALSLAIASRADSGSQRSGVLAYEIAGAVELSVAPSTSESAIDPMVAEIGFRAHSMIQPESIVVVDGPEASGVRGVVARLNDPLPIPTLDAIVLVREVSFGLAGDVEPALVIRPLEIDFDATSRTLIVSTDDVTLVDQGVETPLSGVTISLRATLPEHSPEPPSERIAALVDEEGQVAGQIGPDVIVIDIFGVNTYVPVGGISAYAIGTKSCNIGDVPANWFAPTPNHPVIAQNLFRLANGRYEQLGMSWLKHGFSALTGDDCGDCVIPGSSQMLGVFCSDPYGAGLNGQQAVAGPRSEVNAHTGVFPFPPSNPPWQGTIDRRLQVPTSAVDPTQNIGAVYFGEAHYVTADDAAAGNGNNNASYRRMQFTLTETGMVAGAVVSTVQQQQPGIRAWKDFEPEVVETDIQIPAEGLFLLAAKASEVTAGIWHYEYALQNLNSDRSGAWFNIPLPDDAVISNVGFHDVSYHSGEIYDSTDWNWVVGENEISWSTVEYATNPNGNALRWGTLYNFRFDANVEPGPTTITLGLFKPGFPISVTAQTIGPTLAFIDCNDNDIPDHLDISGGTSLDCEPNGVPDECETDCNENMVADPCDLLSGTSQDCNDNLTPDECEPDCDGNGLPDNCEPVPDGDFDGVDDCYDLCPFTSPPNGCLCPPTGLCCFPLVCLEDFPRDMCLALGGTPECIAAPCHDGCLIADVDADGDIDLRDHQMLQGCFSGVVGEPGYVAPSAECLLNFSFDEDEDVDLFDAKRFTDEFVGP